MFSHHRRTAPRPALERRQGGYVLVKFALLLVPLLLMTGLSVDVGYWYSNAADLQKAADAAALAGVVWLPDEGTAIAVAKEAAKRNGFDDAAPNVTVTAQKVNGQNRRLRVTIAQTGVGSFFWSNLGGRKLDMNRSATGEYVLPVPLGSPLNRFGGSAHSDPSLPAADQANLWGNIHGPRTDNRKGDAYAAGCRGSDNCSGGYTSGYRSRGYLYAIDVPAGVSNMSVEIFDAGLYDRGSNESVDTGDRRYTDSGETTTTWTFYDRDGTEAETDDNKPAVETGFCQSGTPGTGVLAEEEYADYLKNKWFSICYRSGTITPGRYYLRVQTSGDGSSANRYALRVLSSSTTKARISAYGDMSMFNNIGAGSATFYLAEVGPEHRGKTLELRLYDPGEVSGDATMQIINPSGSVAPSCNAEHDGAAGGGRFASGFPLTPCQFQSASATQSARFDGLWVTLQIAIPNNYTCTPGTIPGCWWKVRYIISGQATDTTTWAANIIGDPVHLVEEEAP